MRKGLMAALVAGSCVLLGACSNEDSTDQNVAIDINEADPSDIEAVPADETAGGTAEMNAEVANAN